MFKSLKYRVSNSRVGTAACPYPDGHDCKGWFEPSSDWAWDKPGSRSPNVHASEQ
jgi:hypothetical protein